MRRWARSPHKVEQLIDVRLVRVFVLENQQLVAGLELIHLGEHEQGYAKGSIPVGCTRRSISWSSRSTVTTSPPSGCVNAGISHPPRQEHRLKLASGLELDVPDQGSDCAGARNHIRAFTRTDRGQV